MTDIDEILDLTPTDLHYLVQGVKLKRLDDIQRELENESLRMKMSASNDKGKPLYKNIKEIFDYDKEVKKVLQEDNKFTVSAETVNAFAKSKNYAEELVNKRFAFTAREETVNE